MSDELPDRSPLEPVVSPLAEADPNAINQFIQERVNRVMNTRPLSLTDEDLRVAVEYYRANRARFIIESQQKVPRSVAAAAKKAAPKSVADALATSVDLL